jgi:hypothetical protein
MFYVTELQERTAVYVIGDRVNIAKKHAAGGSNRNGGEYINKTYEYDFSYFIRVKCKK